MPLRPLVRAIVAWSLAGSLGAVAACGGASPGRSVPPAATPAAAPARTAARPAGRRAMTPRDSARRELLRVEAAAGGGVDIRAHRGDSTVSLTLRVAGDTTPRAATRMRIAAGAARFRADSIARLVNRELAAGEELRLRLPGFAGEPAMELVRADVPGALANVRMRSTADSSFVALRPDEVRGVARMLRMAAIMAAPVSDEETASIQVFFEFQVEKPVVPAPGGCYPRYPEELRHGGVTGEVNVQYIVGTDGRAEPETFKVLRSAHAGFTEAVREALPCMRFRPAELHGRKVRQLVQQPFSFDISR